MRVRVMIHLAGSPSEERVSLPELAEATDAPESFLSKVLQALSRAGLISSRRGQSGGFQISQRGREASMLEVIEAIDGPICLNVCLVSGRSCHRKGAVSGASGVGAGANGNAGGTFRGDDRESRLWHAARSVRTCGVRNSLARHAMHLPAGEIGCAQRLDKARPSCKTLAEGVSIKLLKQGCSTKWG